MHQNKKKTTEHNKTKFGVRYYIVPSILLHILYFGIFIFTLYTFDAKYAHSNIVFWHILRTEKDTTLGEKTQNIVRVNVASSSRVL